MKQRAAIAMLLLCSTAEGYYFRGGKAAKMQRQRQKQRKSLARATTQTSDAPSTSAFGTALFAELCAELPTENVLFSPLSVYQAMALVKDGATAQSGNEAELERLLGPESLQDQANGLQNLTTFDIDSGVHLAVATSIWTDQLKQAYIDAAREKYSAEALALPDTYAPVDAWIENKTHGMVKELVGDGPLDPLVVALLVNAVYFKGEWTHRFNASETIDGTFNLGNEVEVPAQYMTACHDMEVIQSAPSLGGAKVLVLDYGKREPESSPEFSAMLILPASPGVESMDDVISGLNSTSISALLDEVATTEVELEFPRFRLDFGPQKLKAHLKSMGMIAAFDPNIPSKFDQMTSDPWVYVDEVHHGACMEVTEEGTEAAAATVVVMMTKSLRRPFPMKLDRPFVMIVFHRPTGIPLFMGKVERPNFFF